jgi:zinc and cadmium transporter
MTEVVVYTLLAVFAVSLISLIGLVLVPARVVRIRSLILFFVGIAVGALLGDAFIHLIPESLKELGGLSTGLWVLGGLGIFFVFEKFLHWHHHHELHTNVREDCEDCEEHILPFGKLIIAADVLHNITDGAIIAAGFLVSFEVGIATTVAVALHEIPQEVGDFGALLHAGFSRAKALLVNFASALSAFVGAVAVLIIGSTFTHMLPVITALTAGSFIYIAIADLMPELNTAPRFNQSIMQFFAVILGVALMAALTVLEG